MFGPILIFTYTWMLAYVLLRAAIIDCERGDAGTGIERATEALGYAELLERATEMLIGNAVLARAFTGAGEVKRAMQHREAADRLLAEGAAGWADELVSRLLETTERAQKRKSR